MGEPKRGPLRQLVRTLRLETPRLLGQVRRRGMRHDRVIGVTGSAGKSTVARLIGRILAAEGPTYVGHGVNTPPGIKRRFFRSPRSQRYWIQEISGHEPGTVAEAARFVRPDIGVLTLVRDDHVKAFGSREALATGKGDLVAALPETGVAVMNADDPLVMEQASRCRCRVLTFGQSEAADVRIVSVEAGLPAPLRVRLRHGDEEATVEAMFPAARWAANIAAAAAAGVAAGVDLGTVAARLSGAEPDMYKDSVHVFDDGTVFVLDSFKASFWTLEGGFDVVSAAEAPRKTYVLGTLSDYRGSPRSRYSDAARGALAVADRVMAYGPHAYRLQRMLPDHPDRLFLFERFADLAAHLDDTAHPGELIYVKASGSDHLERLMHRKRRPILCERDACGVILSTCRDCKRLYGRRLSAAEREALR